MKPIYFLLLVVQVNVAAAQESFRLSLTDIFQRIDTAYPEVLAYASRIHALQAQAEGTKAWMTTVR